MTSRQQWGLVAGLVAVLGGGLWAATHFLEDDLFPVTVGSRAPGFQAKDVHSGKVKSLDDYKGQVVLLNIWATWCPPCKAEMPSIEQLYKTYGKDGLKVVAVSIDEWVGTDSVRAFANNFGLTFDVLHDPQYLIEKSYQTTGYPETFVIGKDGIIRRKWIGAADWNSGYNRALVAQLLGVEAPRPVAADTTQVAPGDTSAVWSPRPARASGGS